MTRTFPSLLLMLLTVATGSPVMGQSVEQPADPGQSAEVEVPDLAEEDCSCDSVPFSPEPPCGSVCPARLLQAASESDLKEVFGLPDSVVKTIIKTQDHNLPTLASYRGILRPKNYVLLRDRVELIDGEVVDFLRQTASVRESLIKAGEAPSLPE